MLALWSVWLGLISLIISMIMVVYRPAFHDTLVVVNLYFCCPLTLTFAGIVLWGTRKEKSSFIPARLQAKVGATLAIVAAIMIYFLVHFARRVSIS